jgi:LacI family transcriptional regulator
VEHLLAQGHRRIAYIGGDPAVGAGATRREGYREALRHAGIPYDADLVSLGNHTVEAAQSAATALLTGPASATAIFADNNRISVGVIRAVVRHGGEIGVAGFDDVELADVIPLRVALVTYDAVELGRRAAELFGSDKPFTQVVLPTTLVVRGRAAHSEQPSVFQSGGHGSGRLSA